jgi:hypothetical protein
MNRLDKVLANSHGCYRPFMALLRDVFFIPCHADIEVAKEKLRRRLRKKLNDDVEVEMEVSKVERENYRYFIRRVRRVIPAPSSLYKEFKAAVDLFADVRDNKTGAPFFSKAAWAVCDSTVKHILKGCISDCPGVGVETVVVLSFRLYHSVLYGESL